MGKLEEKSAKRKRRVDLQKVILNVVAGAGILAVGLIAPNALGALGKLGIIPTRRYKDAIVASRARLVRRGLLVYEDKKLRLTPKGEDQLRHLELKDFKFKTPKRWDGRWRVLIFDIPERRKGLRDKVRLTLSRVGFVRLQDSVWLYPYPCEDLLTLLKADFRIGKDMLYMIVDTLEYDTPFRKKFGLA